MDQGFLDFVNQKKKKKSKAIEEDEDILGEEDQGRKVKFEKIYKNDTQKEEPITIVKFRYNSKGSGKER